MILVIPDNKAMRLRVVSQHMRLLGEPAGGAMSLVAGDGGAPAPSVPINTALPAITGTVRSGESLTCSTGTWTNSPSSYAYQWTRDGSNIGGATSSTYELTNDDVGALIACVVVATNAAGSGSATALDVGPVIGFWTPADLGADLALWLDADDASTITLNGSNVAQWDDKSGNNRHAVQTTAASQPAYTGQHIQFDGLTSLTCVPSWDNTWEWLLVGKFDRTDVLQVLLRDNASGASTAIVGWSSSADFYRVRQTSSPLITNIATEFGTDRFIQGLSSRASDTAVAFTNGVQKSSWAVTGLMGSTLHIGINGTFGRSGLQGSISELVLLANEASTDDRQKLEGYLAWKWGLEANLPADHPYKTTPPTV